MYHSERWFNDLSLSTINSMLEMLLDDWDMTFTTSRQYHIGEGGLIVLLGSNGNLICVWDGREHIDIHLFTIEEMERLHQDLVKGFSTATHGNMKIGLRDDQPRGIGRVINFPSDLEIKKV